jgi:hypothetical protein
MLFFLLHIFLPEETVVQCWGAAGNPEIGEKQDKKKILFFLYKNG